MIISCKSIQKGFFVLAFSVLTSFNVCAKEVATANDEVEILPIPLHASVAKTQTPVLQGEDPSDPVVEEIPH
jgi:hypothetical protein